MEKLNRPKGLIRFASESLLEGKRSPILRLRLAGYGIVMLCAISVVLYGFSDTTSLLVEVRRDRVALFTQLDEHTVCNNYRMKVEGVSDRQDLIALSLTGSGQFEFFGPETIDLTENNSTWLPYRVCARGLELPVAELTFHFKGQSGSASKDATFLTRSF